MSLALLRNIGAFITTRAGQASSSATAGGSGDNTAVTGFEIDLLSLGQKPESAVMVIRYKAVLAATQTISFAYKAQQSSIAGMGSGLSDLGTAVASTVIDTGGSGGTTEHGTVEYKVDLTGAERYIRSNVTPNLSASGTDTCEFDVIWIFGGVEVPVS